VAAQHARWQPGPTRHSTPATTGWPPTRTCWASAFSRTAQSTALSSARADNPGRTWVSRDRGSTPGRDPDHNHSAADSVEDGALFRTGPRVESTTGQTARSRERRQPRIMGEERPEWHVAATLRERRWNLETSTRTAVRRRKTDQVGDLPAGAIRQPKGWAGERPFRRQALGEPGTCERPTRSSSAFPIGRLIAQDPFSRMDDR
jgi:hypothetical protein